MEKEKLITLVTKAQNGDNEAKNALFSEFYNVIYDFACKTLKDETLACDITQDTFLDILRTINTLKVPEAFVSWAKKIAYHQCTRYFKKKKDILVDEYEDGGNVFDIIEDTDTAVIPQELYEKEDFCTTIKDMVNNLSEEQRSAVTLFYFDELTIAKIAEIQSVSEGTVKSRLNYARKALRKSVESYEDKSGIRLHSFSLAPLFLLGLGSKNIMPLAKFTAIQQKIASSVIASAGAGAKASGATTGTAAVATKTSVSIGAKVLSGVTTKIIAGILAATMITGGTIFAINKFNNNSTPEDDFDYIYQNSSADEYTEEESDIDPYAELMAAIAKMDAILAEELPGSEYSGEPGKATYYQVDENGNQQTITCDSYTYNLTSPQISLSLFDGIITLEDSSEINLGVTTMKDMEDKGWTLFNTENNWYDFMNETGNEIRLDTWDENVLTVDRFYPSPIEIVHNVRTTVDTLTSTSTLNRYENSTNFTIFDTITYDSSIKDVINKIGTPDSIFLEGLDDGTTILLHYYLPSTTGEIAYEAFFLFESKRDSMLQAAISKYL